MNKNQRAVARLDKKPFIIGAQPVNNKDLFTTNGFQKRTEKIVEDKPLEMMK